MVFHVEKWAEVIGLQLLDLKIDPGSTKGWVPQKLPSSGSDFQVPAAVFRGVLILRTCKSMPLEAQLRCFMLFSHIA